MGSPKSEPKIQRFYCLMIVPYFLAQWYSFPMTATHWTLAATLKRRGLSPHALIKATGLSKNTVYDIVNGKSQGITLETVDRLLDGLEELTGQRMSLDALLGRHEAADPYAHLFAGAKPYDPAELLPHWTPEEQAELGRHWDALEQEKRQRHSEGRREREALFEEDAGPVTPEPQGRPA